MLFFIFIISTHNIFRILFLLLAFFFFLHFHINFLLFFGFRPDCEKKAYVRLASDHDGLDVANKVSRMWIAA